MDAKSPEYQAGYAAALADVLNAMRPGKDWDGVWPSAEIEKAYWDDMIDFSDKDVDEGWDQAVQQLADALTQAIERAVSELDAAAVLKGLTAKHLDPAALKARALSAAKKRELVSKSGNL